MLYCRGNRIGIMALLRLHKFIKSTFANLQFCQIVNSYGPWYSHEITTDICYHILPARPLERNYHMNWLFGRTVCRLETIDFKNLCSLSNAVIPTLMPLQYNTLQSGWPLCSMIFLNVGPTPCQKISLLWLRKNQ